MNGDWYIYKMKKSCKVENKENLVNNIYKMTFNAGESGFKSPGQYAIIEAKGRRKPYQVCEFDSNRFTIVFPADDDISKDLSELNPGDEVIIDGGLGRGFNSREAPQEVCIVANGCGIPEMVGVARALLMRGKKCKTILEYPSKKDIYMLESFKDLVNEIEVVTLDGSNGREGHAEDVVRTSDYVFASGTLDMLKKLAVKVPEGQFSFGSTILMHSDDYDDCFLETTEGRKNCSDDGPVFDKSIIKWDALDIKTVDL